MFVDHIESSSEIKDNGFLIDSVADLMRIRSSAVISLVIDTDRGSDLAPDGEASNSVAATFEQELRESFSAKELADARATIEATTPIVRSIFSEVRLSRSTRLADVDIAVEQILSTAADSMPAVITLARMKSRDHGTFLHSLAVSALMTTFGRQLEMDANSIRLLASAGLLHDIGKMALPQSILSKDTKLTPEEYEVVKSHPKLGLEILHSFGDVPVEVMEACLHHHERYDGDGYPYRLRARAIPFVARFAAICDVYEALTTVRPYKKAWTPIEAVRAMTASFGQFDRRLLDQFVSKVVLAGEAG